MDGRFQEAAKLEGMTGYGSKRPRDELNERLLSRAPAPLADGPLTAPFQSAEYLNKRPVAGFVIDAVNDRLWVQ